MSSSLILWNNNEPFLDWIVWCLKKSEFYDNQQWPDQWLVWEAQKHFPKSNLHQKKVMVTVGGLLPIWSTTAFWILRTPLHIWEIHSASSWDAPKTSVPAVSIGQLNEPSSSPRQCLTACHTTTASKVQQIGLWRFASSTINTWPPANQLPLLQASWPLFLQGKCFHNQQEAENAFQEFTESRSMDFYAIGINKHFLLGKMCWLVVVPILINKDVFEPSYNDLKFTVNLKFNL